MSNIDQSLAPGEYVVYRTGLTRWLWLAAALGAVASLLGAVAVSWLAGFGMLVAAAPLVWLTTTEIAITDRRLIHRSGWFRPQVAEFDFAQIDGIDISQDILGRLTGAGTVEVRRAGARSLKVRAVDDPLRLRRVVAGARERTVGQA